MKTTIVLLTVLSLVIPAAAQRGSLLVLSKHDHTLAIVDPQTLKVRAKAPVGDDPHEVIASADGRTAWVSNYGSGWSLHTLAVIDLVNGKALSSIDLSPLNGAHGLALSGGKPWFTAEGSKVVGRIDPASGKVDMVLGTGQDRTHMLWVSPDGKQIITTNVNAASVSILDQVPVRDHVEWTQTVIPVGRGDEGFDLSPDGHEIWVANAQDGTISVIDRAAKKVIATLQSNTKSANRLKFTPDGAYVLVSVLSGPNVTVLDAHTRAVTKHIPVGTGAAGIQIQPDGARAFVACTPDNYVAVIDLKTWTVTSHLDVGAQPDGMDWSVRP